MKYVVVSFADDVDLSGIAIGAEASLVVGDKTIAGTVQLKGEGANPEAAETTPLAAHTHAIAPAATGPAVAS
jgi:hypothetical protein